MIKNKGRRQITITLLHGKIAINRTVLQIKDNINLKDYNFDSKELIPFDEFTKIDKLPFKISKDMMAEIAFCGQNQASFSDAKMLLERYRNIKTNTDTILQVTEYVGNLVFEHDDKKAQENYSNIANLIEDKPKTKKNLYAEVDGSAINTRIEDENGSTWKKK